MKNLPYRMLMRAALLLTIAWVGWSIYDGAFREKINGEGAYHAGNKFFEDGHYEKAINSYQSALKENPQLIHAKRGIARTLMQLGENDKALEVFNEVIDKEPEFGASFANRGILHDRMQNYVAAIADYQKAIQLDPQLKDGPSWITRFLRNEVAKPSTILDRLNYLQNELKKPIDKQVLQIKEKDNEQRPYKR